LAIEWPALVVAAAAIAAAPSRALACGGLFCSSLIAKLRENAIDPVLKSQELIESRPYLTRLYTTLSASEMTVDPSFAINPDLEPVSNVHVADRIVSCDGLTYRVKLAQGTTVRGNEVGTWPLASDAAPAALQVMEYGPRGHGRVLADNHGETLSRVRQHNEEFVRTYGDGDKNGSCTAVHGGPPSGHALALWIAVIALLTARRSRAAQRSLPPAY
jgi:hypothetical protein